MLKREDGPRRGVRGEDDGKGKWDVRCFLYIFEVDHGVVLWETRLCRVLSVVHNFFRHRDQDDGF